MNNHLNEDIFVRLKMHSAGDTVKGVPCKGVLFSQGDCQGIKRKGKKEQEESFKTIVIRQLIIRLLDRSVLGFKANRSSRLRAGKTHQPGAEKGGLGGKTKKK